MAIINGSVSDGIHETKYNYFPPIFKEFLGKEAPNWWRREINSSVGWVFSSQQDLEIEPPLSLDDNVSGIRKVRDQIRDALQKMINNQCLDTCLVQFWAATITSEGQTKLTTQYQPFALGDLVLVEHIQGLCEYRMEMCREYKFYADARYCGEEQLGLPVRVFLHKFPESSQYVKYYSATEYPQRSLAESCKISGSWGAPVFEPSSQTCVGVLEILSMFPFPVWRKKSLLSQMYTIFQGVKLQCFDGCHSCEKEFGEKGKRVKGHTRALQELKTVLKLVCETHDIALAVTWVPCSACNGLRRCNIGSMGVEFCLRRDSCFGDFLNVGKCSHVRKGLVARRVLSPPNMLYCSDITQLSIDEYPLVPYARQGKFSGCFTICLKSVSTGNDIYVIEFFLFDGSQDNENIQTRLSYILGTMELKFQTFRLASGKELGGLKSFDFIYFQNGQKVLSVQQIQATRSFSSQSSDPPSVESLAIHSRQLIRDTRNLSRLSPDPSPVQSSASVSTRPRLQDANMVNVKAKYGDCTIMFKLSSPYRLVELHQEVARRLPPEAGTYHFCYEYKPGDLILITLDEDLQSYVEYSLSMGSTPTVVVFLRAN